jgi:thiamine pyrophosphate-dependent acetolactate synthase large subunit-like protein
LLTQGLYNKKIKLPVADLSTYKGINSKKSRLLFKIVRYFSPKSILIVGATTFEKEVMALANPKAKIDIDIDNAIYNCIYFSSIPTNSITNETIEQLALTIENDSFWIIENIHANAAAESLWQTLKQNPKVTVTIDTYHFGLVFFRKEQVKEHFIIRA